MADLTPNDILNKSFHQTLRGYSVDEVEEFQQLTSESLFHAYEEIQRLRAQVEGLREQVERYRGTEDLIKNALVLAERTAEEARQRAHEEAELIKREARLQLQDEHNELAALRQDRRRVIAELTALLYSHLSLLKQQEKEDDKVSTPR